MNFNDIYEDYLLTVEQVGISPSESLLLASITEQSLMRYYKGKALSGTICRSSNFLLRVLKILWVRR